MAAEILPASLDSSEATIELAPYGVPANGNETGVAASRQILVGDWRKRSFDLCASLVLVILLSPMLLMIVAVVRLSSPGPVFYGHERVGRNGAVFRCWKFRTMVMNGDEMLQRHLALSAEAAEEWRTTRKLRNDPRITGIGWALRMTSLDELPQLFNVLRGQMSLVGPRPVVHEELAYYGGASVLYLSSRPGITGLWQVSGRNDVSYGARVRMDSLYCLEWSFGRDVLILLKTFRAVLSARGTY